MGPETRGSKSLKEGPPYWTCALLVAAGRSSKTKLRNTINKKGMEEEEEGNNKSEHPLSGADSDLLVTRLGLP